jgi:hypothetical protein
MCFKELKGEQAFILLEGLGIVSVVLAFVGWCLLMQKGLRQGPLITAMVV